jgi:hypothetical protein
MGNAERLYLIADPGDGYYWLCGHASGERQVFVYGGSGCLPPPREIISIFFDRDGNLLGHQSVAVPPSEPSGGPGWLDSAQAAFKKAMDGWLAKIEFHAATIRVRRFSCDEVLIEGLPHIYQDFLANPESPEWENEGAQTMRRRIERWIADKRYVLFFDQEFWMDSDGTIEST